MTRATGLLSAGALTFMSASALMAQTVIIKGPALPPPPSVVIHVPPPPVVVVPAPTVTVDVVPDSYVWDSREYVGVVGAQFVFLGPGNVWLPMPHERIEFFHDWEKHHQDWREHCIVNERYRTDAHGKVHPWKGHHQDQGQDHDSDHHDHGHDNGHHKHD